MIYEIGITEDGVNIEWIYNVIDVEYDKLDNKRVLEVEVEVVVVQVEDG